MNRIEWITRAIAQPYIVQKNLFPGFVNVADELAIEWELALEDIDHLNFTEEQKLSLKNLDDFMLSISGESNIQYWNDEALCNSNEWKKMRALADNIIAIMGWDDMPPPRNNGIYINNP
ncbi:hypothetical protein SMY46_004262 [Cronobacter turicensis]|uniref:hypothetical protein n=1 Tax=Cronobacter turicensis TaxID=413502 RepID=UPI0011AD3626|nr:hypothetical protein [Cronobacter turicensis]ELU8456537.1 hypothetical protein [Cronobacter turicensis]ELY4112520.1 hypothetical protein [Cronobacter turicensis]ELY4217834.1 hypothetical protein [Cronobacter turicensis]EMA1793528.1 hypothetical protein [Cronobacter turicensis]EMA1802834.1 hypothetical protein [Cronobacter turicensis]